MIIKRICPQTGIANFFAAADPFISIGSVATTKRAAQYDWRCYLDEPVAGTAREKATAETQLRQAIESRRRHERSRHTAQARKARLHADIRQH
jgi:hypothetical protein